MAIKRLLPFLLVFTATLARAEESWMGIYLQGNDMARPIFESWLNPFKDLGASSISIRRPAKTTPNPSATNA